MGSIKCYFLIIHFIFVCKKISQIYMLYISTSVWVLRTVVTLQPGFGWKVTEVITLLINPIFNNCSLINILDQRFGANLKNIKKREPSLIFSSLKKSMILLNFPSRWYLNILNLCNISIILKKWIIQWFSFDVTTRSRPVFEVCSTQYL